MNKEEKVFEYCFKEMFRRVGEKYPNKELTDNNNWYELRSWTQKEEKSFYYWVVGYLRRELKWTKERSKNQASLFCLQYAWTNKQKLTPIKVIKK